VGPHLVPPPLAGPGGPPPPPGPPGPAPPPPPPRPPRGADGHAMQQAGGHTCSKLAAHGNPASLAVPVPADWKPYDVPADYQVPVVDYQSADTILNAKK